MKKVKRKTTSKKSKSNHPLNEVLITQEELCKFLEFATGIAFRHISFDMPKGRGFIAYYEKENKKVG